MTSPIPLGMEMEDVWDRRFIVILLKMDFFLTNNSTVKVKILKSILPSNISLIWSHFKNLKKISSYITSPITYFIRIKFLNNQMKKNHRTGLFFGTNTQKLNWVGTILLTQSAWLIHDLYWVKYATFSWFVDCQWHNYCNWQIHQTELKFPICSRGIMNLENTYVKCIEVYKPNFVCFSWPDYLTLPKQTNHA
jgi:hypothetical protein